MDAGKASTFRDMSPEEYQQWLEDISRKIDDSRAYGPEPHSTFIPWPDGGFPGEA